MSSNKCLALNGLAAQLIYLSGLSSGCWCTVFCELSFILIGSGFAVLNSPFSLAVAFKFSKCVSVTTVLLKCVSSAVCFSVHIYFPHSQFPQFIDWTENTQRKTPACSQRVWWCFRMYPNSPCSFNGWLLRK